MPRVKKVTLREDELQEVADAHTLIARKLDFPAYYGANLDALADCLGDIDRPTRIVVVRSEDDRKPWFDDLEETIRECCQESCFVGCTIR